MHHIVTKGPPVYARLRRLMSDKLSRCEFDHTIIRPLTWSWPLPFHLVSKKAVNYWRSSGDFCEVNNNTLPGDSVRDFTANL